MVLTFDIGGSSTKIAIIDDELNFIEHDYIQYEKNKNGLMHINKLLKLIKERSEYFNTKYKLKAICISTCGVVKDDGSVWFSFSIEDYSGINWKNELSNFNLPVYVENDCKCALLAEYKYGVAQNYKTAVSLVLGTGVGGGLIIDGKFFKELNAEFGCFLEKFENDTYMNYSWLGSPVNYETQLNKIFKDNRTLKEYIKDYDNNDVVKKYLDEMIFINAKNIINIYFVINAEIFVIGGAISNNDWFVSKLKEKVKELGQLSFFKISPNIVAAKFKSNANLIGAYSLIK